MMFTLTLGANDGLRGLPITQVKANLSPIIETANRRSLLPPRSSRRRPGTRHQHQAPEKFC
jgi:hypothetical protein